MKVKDLMNTVHLLRGQETTIRVSPEGKVYTTHDRYDFEVGGEEREWLYNLRVNSFSANSEGITIYAQEVKRKK